MKRYPVQKRLDIVSLGPGKVEQLTLEAKEALLKSKKIYCRFINPILEYFIKRHKKVVISLRGLYDDPNLVQGIERKPLYKRIAEFIVDEATNNEGIAYALPGSALIIEDTTYLIYELAKAKRLKINTILGISFVDVLLNSLPERYKRYIYPQRMFVVANLNMPFNGYFSYIIAQTSDLVQEYRPDQIEETLSRHYPKDYKFLYIYNKDDHKNFSYKVKVIEFQAKDIKNMIDIFRNKNGTIFIPARLSDYEKSYGKLFDTPPKYKREGGISMLKRKIAKGDYLKRRYERNEDIVSRKIGNEMVLVPVRRRGKDIQDIFTLNQTGSFIWELIDGKRPVSHIREQMAKEFDITNEEADEDLIQVLKQLEEVGAIK